MKNLKNIALIIGIAGFLLSCTAKKPVTKISAYGNLYEEKPLTILLMPPINKSTEVEAKLGLYTSLAIPLVNKGYYVMPSNMALDILRDQSAYDSELFIDRPMTKAGEAFAVDAVLFTIIHEWRKVATSSLVEVTIEYRLKSTKTNKILFQRKGEIEVRPNNQTGSLIADIAANALSTALQKQVAVGRACNRYALKDLPEGKYGTLFQLDGEEFIGPEDFKVQLSSVD